MMMDNVNCHNFEYAVHINILCVLCVSFNRDASAKTVS